MRAKELPKVEDSLVIEGGISGEKKGGLRSKDGNPVSPEVIAKAFGVDIETAKEISRRLSL